jgi:hypothetical protein
MSSKFSRSYLRACEQDKTSGIAIPGDNGFAVLHVPKSWAGKRVFAMTSEYFNALKEGNKK